ncbi:MAG TPA: DUF5722 domain-containing protein, partial [Planctomycetaceae bacterium]
MFRKPRDGGRTSCLPGRLRYLFISLVLLVAPAASADAAPPDAAPFPQPRTKKGLQVQMIDDALALGVEHAALNVDITRLIDPSGKASGPRHDRDGRRYDFTKAAVEDLDVRVKLLSDKGVVVYLILLPYASGDAARDALLLHPNYARGKKETGPIGMFNTTTPESTAWLAAVVEFLAARYNSQERGRVWGYIAGNEANSHWFWANMGLANADEVVEAYERAVRTIHAAVRTASANARTYISLEHCWARRYSGGNASQCIAGRTFLDAFSALVRQHGDFDWHVAYHPYPEPLTECRFWLDTTHSVHRTNAPIVSLRNLEVLTSYLRQDELRWDGEPRRVILSEQGFHCSDRPDAEREQAAAFALAYKTVARADGIDAFILHRHVDHADEGGLRLGLWTNKPGAISTPDRKRAMYDVFRAAGTAEEDKQFEFALPILGAASWNEILERVAER